MKNTNLQLKKTKLIAKLMLIVVLVVGMLNLSACEWKNIFTTTTEDIDGGYGSIVNDGWRRDDFATLNDLINKKVPDGYYFITFNFDNEDCYVVNPYYVFLKSTLSGPNDREHLWKTCYIEGSSEIVALEEANTIKISYVSFVLEGIDLSDTSLFHIKALPDKIDELDIGYRMVYGIYMEEKLLMRFTISSKSQKLSEEKFSEICNALKKNICVMNYGE